MPEGNKGRASNFNREQDRGHLDEKDGTVKFSSWPRTRLLQDRNGPQPGMRSPNRMDRSGMLDPATERKDIYTLK